MPRVESYSEWRNTARELLRAGKPPHEVHWANEEPDLFEEDSASYPPITRPRVPRAFLELAERAACYRHSARWALLYRALWRLNTSEPHLLEIASDADVVKLNGMVGAVNRDIHKMHAFVRFRQTNEGIYIAWHEPAHLVVEVAAPFFARRFDSIQWSILTPDRCAFWDGETLSFGEGVTRERAPKEDEMEDLWKTYYTNIFNPARVKVQAMVREMPKRHWKTMPETALIPRMIADAESRVATMLERSRERQVETNPTGTAQKATTSRDSTPSDGSNPSTTPLGVKNPEEQK